jgi:hypothetical protein
VTQLEADRIVARAEEIPHDVPYDAAWSQRAVLSMLVQIVRLLAAVAVNTTRRE